MLWEGFGALIAKGGLGYRFLILVDIDIRCVLAI